MKTEQKLVLDLECDARTCEDCFSPSQSHCDTKEDDRTETGCTEWTDTVQL